MANFVAELGPLLDGAYIWAWALAFAGTAGFVAGGLYRVTAAIMLSFTVLIAAIIIGVDQQWPFWKGALFAFGLLTTLQVGYLLGVVLASRGGKLRATLARRVKWAAIFKRDMAR